MKRIKNHYDKIVLTLMSLTPIVWFFGKGDKIINGLDTNFPLDPEVWLARRFFVWNDTLNAGVNSASSTSGWFFHLVQYVPFRLGFDLQATQIISLVFWFTAIVMASYYFSRTLVSKNKIAQLTFTFIYSFNIYLFNTWENVKVANIALMIGIPLLMGILHRLYKQEYSLSTSLFMLIPTALLTAGSGINPAYFIAIFMVNVFFSIYLLLLSREKRNLALQFLIVLGVYVLLNLYWIAPFLRYLLVSVKASSFEQIGFTNWISSLSENTSLLNVLRLQGAWDWYTLDNFGIPLYIPYAVNYFYNLPFVAFSFVLPLLALLSLVFRKENIKLYLFFAMISLVGIFMGAGVHEPTGYVFNLFAKYIPFFSFFRSPWYIFTPYLVLGYAALVALFVSRLYEACNMPSGYFKRFVNAKAVTVVILVMFMMRGLYLYPLLTGKIYRIERPDSFFVTFPEYVFESKDVLEGDEYSGRIITYPDDQLEQFDWGYRGTESILSLYTDKEVISPSFVFTGESTQAMLDEFYRYLKTGDYESAYEIAGYLNANTIMVKNDSTSLSPQVSLGGYLSKQEVGMWDFYTIDSDYSKIYVPDGYYENTMSDKELGSILPNLESTYAVVNEGDTVVNKITGYEQQKNSLLKAKNITLEENPSSNHHKYMFSVEDSGKYSIVIAKNGLNPDDWSVTSSTVNFGGASVNQSASYYMIENVSLSDGTHYIDIVFPEQRNLITQENIENAYSEPPIRQDELPQNEKTLVAYNGGNEDGVETKILVEDFDPYANYEISFNYKYFYGGIPFIEVIQSHVSAPLKIETIYTGSDIDWVSMTEVYEPVGIDSKLEVNIKTPLKQYENTSKTFIEDLRFTRLYDNNVYVIEDSDETKISSPNITFKKISPVEYEVIAENVSDSYPLVFLENYSPDWELRGDNSVGNPLHFKVNGYANAWYIPANSSDQTFTLYYKAQDYYLYSSYLSIATVISIVIYAYTKRNKQS